MISIINKFKTLFKEPYRLIGLLNKIHLLDLLNDNSFHKIIYFANTGKRLDINNPVGFCDKLHWMMINYHDPKCSELSDKYQVRNFIKEKIGEQYLIPLLGIYENPSDIDYNKLPDKFVLKCNHNSGTGMYICKSKKDLDIKHVNKKLRKGLKNNGYKYTREWNYKQIKPLIVCEKYMIDEYSSSKNIDGLLDYKFYCFNGVPKFLYVSITAEDKSMSLNYYDIDFNLAPFYRDDHPSLPFTIDKPKCYNEMLQIAKILSKGFPFVRVDLYQINNSVYFSELTFTPGAGNSPFSPEEWENKIGSWIELPKINN